ncbi:DUF2306 domain-containing protein [Fulvivirgaceae bacterium PWU4]|uniref:DUF2306 domain-containing protein n=1 Tax=Chryseosolibacter histidini TaxID=2782349 RepID=A0AAP2DHX4_9BACT|nr:DUF2306 domain-containing protein [Chryseosolibacter histidini]MBT1696676.1 DUF2306 domain-containing protein [Chryseosolibacter histidini]
MNFSLFLRILLIIHIAGGTTALVSGLISMLTRKGGTAHRRAGKIYCWGMSAVFISAVILSLAKDNIFLLLVGFFSYYLTVRGYRILYLKNLPAGQKAMVIDWLITGLAGLFILALTGWGIFLLTLGHNMGIVAVAFAFIGSLFVRKDIRQFVRPPQEKMHWWYGHISSMGGSYISALTAFIVTNIQLPEYQWVLWLLPSVVGTMLILRTIRHYKTRFNKQAGVVTNA